MLIVHIQTNTDRDHETSIWQSDRGQRSSLDSGSCDSRDDHITQESVVKGRKILCDKDVDKSQLKKKK